VFFLNKHLLKFYVVLSKTKHFFLRRAKNRILFLALREKKINAKNRILFLAPLTKVFPLFDLKQI
jgi:hypothetical protein